jgi:uncharacterized integral membrane protein
MGEKIVYAAKIFFALVMLALIFLLALFLLTEQAQADVTVNYYESTSTASSSLNIFK